MTVGWSPKVLVPGLVLIGVGLVLVVAGVLLAEPELRTIGYTAIGTGAITLGVGRAMPPGEVLQGPVGPASDELLPDAVKAKLATRPRR